MEGLGDTIKHLLDTGLNNGSVMEQEHTTDFGLRRVEGVDDVGEDSPVFKFCAEQQLKIQQCLRRQCSLRERDATAPVRIPIEVCVEKLPWRQRRMGCRDHRLDAPRKLFVLRRVRKLLLRGVEGDLCAT